jgi:hypothetical protein
MKIEKQATYSYSLGLNLSIDTHIDDLLAFFQNGAKSTNDELKKLSLQNCELEMGEDIHQVSKHLMKRRLTNPKVCFLCLHLQNVNKQ